MDTGKRSPRKTLVMDARAAVRDCAGLNARLAARRIAGFIEARMGREGMSLAQFGLLAHVAAAEDDTIGALSRRMGLDQTTLSRTLRGLERAGLVEIAVVEADLRRRAVWLTEAGARRLESAIPAWRRAQRELAARLGDGAARALAQAAAALETPPGQPDSPP